MTKEQVLNNYIDHTLALPIRINHIHNEFESYTIGPGFQLFWIKNEKGDQPIVVANDFYFEVASFVPHTNPNVIYIKIRERIDIHLNAIKLQWKN